MNYMRISIQPFRTKLLYGKAVLFALSWSRLWNLTQWYWNKSRKKSAPMPISFSLETSTACNLSCPECPSGLQNFTRVTGNLKKETLLSTLTAMKDSAIWMNFYLQGEPLLHPKFIEWVAEAKRYNFFVQTSTNAQLLDKIKAEEIVQSGMDRILIALDGYTQNSYETYRVTGSVEKVFQAIQNLVEAKQKLHSAYPIISIQTIVGPHNAEEIEELRNWFPSSGANELLFKSMQTYSEEKAEEFHAELGNLSRYTKSGFEQSIPKGEICNRAFSSCVISHDGTIAPCCFDKDNTHAYGEIHEKGALEKHWKGGKGAKFKQDFKSGYRPEICSNCSERRRVWL